jgi:hypothetical protein
MIRQLLTLAAPAVLNLLIPVSPLMADGLDQSAVFLLEFVDKGSIPIDTVSRCLLVTLGDKRG